MIPLGYIIRNLATRWLNTSFTIFGIALSIAIYTIMSSITQTMVNSFRTTGEPDEIVVTQRGAMTVDFSNVERRSTSYIETMPDIAKTGLRPIISPELYLSSIITVHGREVSAYVRGIFPANAYVYRQAHLASGRWMSGGGTAVIGSAISSRLGLGIDDTFELQKQRYRITGIISAMGRVFDNEIWVDVDELAAESNRLTYTGYTVRFNSRNTAKEAAGIINDGRQYPLVAMSAPDFYKRTGAMAIFMAYIGSFISIVIAIGAAIGGMNTMYSSVAGRSKEIGILRALGFGRTAIMFSFLTESLVICLCGWIIGLFISLILSIIHVDLPYLSNSRIVIDYGQILSSCILSLCIGLIGGGLPSLHAARLNIVKAFRT